MEYVGLADAEYAQSDMECVGLPTLNMRRQACALHIPEYVGLPTRVSG
ncbi:MAG: hypothetical protein LLG44_14405 [Chloroflexi bacterium]|nr:hypothetical protein [Chloroflexota bacterium]